MGNCCNTSSDREPTNVEAQFPTVEEENHTLENNNNNDNYVNNDNNANNINNNVNTNLKYQITNIFDQKRNQTEPIIQMKTWAKKKDYLSQKNYSTIDKPDIIDNLGSDNNNDFSINMSIDQSEFIINLSQMENKLFDIINELRTNPQSFITHIEKYKSMLKKEDDKYFIIIDENEFEFKEGIECFDDCIELLKDQKHLKKFEKSLSMFESKKLFIDKNVSDLLFVAVYNLMDVCDVDNSKIRRKCLLSEEYNKLNITISKNESGNKLYSYYFSFDIF
jgi:hypothetical protein